MSILIASYGISPSTPDGESIGDVLHLPAGANHLDGETALKYATYRYGSTDWDRARRQQTFLLAARSGSSGGVGTLFQVPALWPSFKDYFSTESGAGGYHWAGPIGRRSRHAGCARSRHRR